MKTLLKTLRTLVCFMMISSTLQAADRYWVGGTDSLWNNTANWSTTSGGSGGASVPGANDVAILDGGSTKPCYTTQNITVQQVRLASGFAYTFFQQQYKVTATVGGISIAAGTWQGSTGNIDITAGGVTQSGGTLNAPDSLWLRGTWNNTGGTFNHNNNRVCFRNSNTISGNSPTFYEAEFYSDGSSGNGIFTLSTDITISQKMITSGTLTVTFATGNIYLEGNLDVLNQYTTSSNSNGTLHFTGSNNQTINGSNALQQGRLPNVTINKTGGTLTLNNFLVVSGTWNYQQGTLNTSNGTVHFFNNSTQTINGNAHTISKATFTTGSYTINAPLTVSELLTIAGAGNQTFSSGNLYVEGNINITNTGITAIIGSATLHLTGSNNQTITGSTTKGAGRLPNVTINKTGGTLTFNNFITVAGTWNYQQGTLNSSNATIHFVNINGQNINGNAHTLSKVIVGNGLQYINVPLTISDELTTEGTLTQAFMGGNIYLQGNLIIKNTYNTSSSGTTTLHFTGTSNQLIDGQVSRSQGRLPHIVINKASGTLQLKGNIMVARSWTHTQGTVDVTTYHSRVLFFNSNNTLTGNLLFDAVEFWATDGLAFTINNNLSNNLLQVKDSLILSGTAILTLNGNTLQAEGHVINTNTAYNGGGTATIQLTGSNNQTLAGLDSATVNAEGRGRLPRLSINKSGGSLTWRGVININGKLTWQQGFSQANTYSKVVLFETDSLLGNTAAAGLTPTTGNMAFYELKYMTNNTRKLQAPLAINRRLILGGSLLKLNSQALNINTKDSTAIEATARLLADDTTSKVIWQIGNSTRTYTVSFVNSSLQAVSLQADITQAGIGNNGSLTFNTYRSNSQNLPYPESNENSFGFIDSNRLKIADRYWLLQHANFDSLPTLTVRTQYAAQDLASPNTINEDSLNSSLFSLPCWTIKTGTLNKAQKHYTATNIKQARVALALHDKSAVPVCNDGKTCANAYLLTAADYNNTVFNMTDTVMWFKFVAEDSIWNAFCTNKNNDNTKFNLTNAKIYQVACNGTLKSNNNVIIDSVKYFIFTDKYVIGTSYFLKFTQPINNSSQFNLFRSKRSFNDCVLTSSSQSSTCNINLDATFGCSLICNPEICEPNPTGPAGQIAIGLIQLDFSTNVKGWGTFFGTPDYAPSYGINPVTSGALHMFANSPDINNENEGEGVHTSVNIQPTRNYLFSIYHKQIPQPFASNAFSDPSLKLIIRGYNSSNPPRNGTNLVYPLGGAITQPEPNSNLIGPLVLEETNIKLNTFQRSVTGFTATTVNDRLYIHPSKQNNNNGSNTSYVVIDQVELIEDLFTAGLDKSVCLGGSVQIGVNFCSPTNVIYEWRIKGTTTVIGNMQTLNVSPTVNTTYVLTRRFEFFNDPLGITIVYNNVLKTDEVIVTVIPNTFANPIIFGNVRTACLLGPHTYEVSNASQYTNATYVWSVTNGTISPNGATANVTWNNENGGIISVYAIVSAGACTTSTTQLQVFACCDGDNFAAPYSTLGGLIRQDANGNKVILGDINAFGPNSLQSLLPLNSTNNQRNGLSYINWNDIKEITINGTLTINDIGNNNSNFGLLTPNLRFGPYARIVVQNNARLLIQKGSKLYNSCGIMWEGIVLQGNAEIDIYGSNVEDAIVAVKCDIGTNGNSGTTKFYINNGNKFLKNRKGILHREYNVQLNNPSEVWGNEFSCSANLLPPYQGTRSTVGIEIRNNGTITLGDAGSGRTNTFANMDTAIYIRNSTATIYNSNISNLNPSTTKRTFGILGYNTISSSLLSINTPIPDITIGGSNTNQSNTIASAKDAIWIDGFENVNVLNNSITGIVTNNSSNDNAGISVLNSKRRFSLNNSSPLPITNIKNNTITTGSNGIQSIDNLGFQNIETNTINLTNGTGPIKVGIRAMSRFFASINTNVTPGTTLLKIINNNTITGAENGILIFNRPNNTVSNCTINLPNPTGNAEIVGINSLSSVNSNICSNIINGSNNNSSSNQTGIWLRDGASSVIALNDIKDLRYCTANSGNSNFTGLRRNKFTNSQVGFRLFSGNIGIQGEPGTSTTLRKSDNEFINGAFTFNQGRLLNESGLLPSSTTFHTKTGPTFCITTPQSTSNSPFFIPISTCSFTNGVNLGCPRSRSNFDVTTALRIAGDSVAYPQDSLLHRWWNRHTLYYSLLLQDSILGTGYTLLDNFVAAHKTTMMPRLDSILLRLETYNGEDTLYDPDGDIPSQYYDLLAQINALQSANTIESSAKQYAKNLLEVKHGSANNEMKGQINTLANRCVFNYGPAVWMARAYMILDSSTLINKAWEANCTAQPRKAIRDRNDEENFVIYDYKLHPTLIGSELRGYIVLNEKEEGYIELYNIMGNKLAVLKVKEGRNELGIPNHIHNGMVTYRVFVNNKLVRTDKIIIMK